MGARFEPLLGLLELAPEHHRNELQPRQLRSRGRPDQPAVAQHRDPISDLIDLVEEVGDEDNRDAMGLEIAHDLEQNLDLVGVETGGRLVEHQHPRVVFKSARNGDQLLNRQRIGSELLLDVDVDLEPL